MGVKNVQLQAGKLVVTSDTGEAREYDLVNYLRAADIPDLTISSLTLLTTLAQVVMVLTKTLVEQDVIGEELVSGFDLQYLLETLIDDLAAEDV